MARAAPMTRGQYVALALLLGAVTALSPLSVDTSLPAMPAMADAFSASVTAVQMTLSALVLGSAFGQLFVGPLSDRFGRRPVLFWALAVFLLSSLGCALAPTIESLAAMRFVQGFSASSFRVLPRAVARDMFDREDAARLLAYMMVIGGAAPIIGPVVGGHFTVWFGWWSVFAFMAAYCAVVVALLALFFQETLPARDPTALHPGRLVRNYWLILRNRRFRSYLACNMALTGGLFAFLSGSSIALIRFIGETPEAFGFDFAIVMSGHVAFSMVSARLVGRLGIDRLLAIGVLVAGTAGLAMGALAWAGIATVAAIVGPMFAFMIAFSLVVPQGTAGALSPFPETAGTASSLLGFLQICTGAAVATAVGLLDDGTQMPMVTIIAAMGVAAVIAYMLLVRPLEQG